MSKKCIVSLANERGNYYSSIARLANSLKGNFDGTFIGYMGEESLGVAKHLDDPYAFKIHAIRSVMEKGYKQVLWLDSSTFAVRNVQPIFDIIEREGYFMQEAGAWAGNWCSDNVLNSYEVSRDEAMGIPMYSAGYTGLNLDNLMALEYFLVWENAMWRGLFKGNWDNNNKTESQDERCKGSRHDMSCGSLIAHKLGMKFKPGDQYIEYSGPNDPIKNDSIVIKNQGM